MEIGQVMQNMVQIIGFAVVLLILGLGGYIWFIRSNQMQGG